MVRWRANVAAVAVRLGLPGDEKWTEGGGGGGDRRRGGGVCCGSRCGASETNGQARGGVGEGEGY